MPTSVRPGDRKNGVFVSCDVINWSKLVVSISSVTADSEGERVTARVENSSTQFLSYFLSVLRPAFAHEIENDIVYFVNGSPRCRGP